MKDPLELVNELREHFEICSNHILQVTKTLPRESGLGVIQCYGCDVTFAVPTFYSTHISDNRKRCLEKQLEVLWKPDHTMAAPDNFQYCLGCGHLVYKLHKNMVIHLNGIHNGRKCRKVIEELLRDKGEDVDQKLIDELREHYKICRKNISQVTRTLPRESGMFDGLKLEIGPGGTQYCYGCDFTFTDPQRYSNHFIKRPRCREKQLEVLWKPGRTLAAPDNFQYCLGCGQLVYKLDIDMAKHLNRSNRKISGKKCKQFIQELFREKRNDVDQKLVNQLRELSKIYRNNIPNRCRRTLSHPLPVQVGFLICFGCGAGYEDIALHSAHITTPIACQDVHLEYIYRMKHEDIYIPRRYTICYGCGTFCALAKSKLKSHFQKNCLSCLSEIMRRVEEIGKDSIANKMILTQYQSLGPFRCYGCDKILKHSFNQHLEDGCRDSHVNRLVELGNRVSVPSNYEICYSCGNYDAAGRMSSHFKEKIHESCDILIHITIFEEIWKKEHYTAADNPYLSLIER